MQKDFIYVDKVFLHVSRPENTEGTTPFCLMPTSFHTLCSLLITKC